MDLDLVSASIIAALRFGIGESNRDAYNALKTALRQKIDKESNIDAVMKLIEKNPESRPRRAMLQKKIATTQAHKDDELNQLAKALLRKLNEISEGEEAINTKAEKIGAAGGHTCI
jgi:hypothetical protein